MQDKWIVSGERVTIFWADPTTSLSWSNIYGDQPENTQFQKAINARKESTNVGESILILGNAPGRTDLVLDAGIPLVEAEKEAYAQFCNAVSTLVQLQPAGITRIAVGRQLFQITKGKEDGYQLLAGYVKNVKIDPLHSSDFLYQINWPETSKTDPNISINRLTKWAVVHVTQFPLNPGIPAPQIIDEKYAVQLELDLSTPAIPISPTLNSNISSWINELNEQCEFIMQNGEPVCKT